MCKAENGINLERYKKTFSKGKKREIIQCLKQETLDLSGLAQIQSHVLAARYEVSFLKKLSIKFWIIETCPCHSYKFTCRKLVFFNIFVFYYGCYAFYHMTFVTPANQCWLLLVFLRPQ